MSITDRLKRPFPPTLIHWRVGATNAKSLNCKPWEATSGIALAYVDARDVMKRFDDVCGDYWQNEYPFTGCCRIGVKIKDEWLWRSNGAGVTAVEEEKGQYSDAFKRAGVLWGVARYLYYLPNVWCDLKKGKIIKPPDLPNWALPASEAIYTRAELDAEIIENCYAEGDRVGLLTTWAECSKDEVLGTAVNALLPNNIRAIISGVPNKADRDD